MNPLETLLRPLVNVLNRNIGQSTPARELCGKLAGKTVAIRVRDTALTMYFEVGASSIALKTDSDCEPDVVLTGSLLTLARMAGPGIDSGDTSAFRDGAIDITGDAFTAQKFQELLRFAKPDLEEELSSVIGDVAAHQAGELARGLRDWALQARSTMAANIREYLQEESRDVPSRYETERFTARVNALRDDVARLEARLNQLTGH